MIDALGPTDATQRVLMHKSNQLLYIQILRFFASAAVVGYHCIETAKRYMSGTTSYVSPLFGYGYLGVDLFFVISGFIIYYSMKTSTISPTRFLLRRIERIIPIYWTMTIFFIVLGIVTPRSLTFDGVQWLTAQHIISSFLLVTFIYNQTPIIYVGWSLEYEMFFYICVYFILNRRERGWDFAIVVLSLLSMCNIATHDTHYGILKFFASPLLLEFIFGVIVAKSVLRAPVSNITIFFVICSIISNIYTDWQNRIIIFGIPAGLIVLGAAFLSKWTPRPSLIERALARLGDASYSIYLTQVFVISAAGKVASRFHPPIELFVFITMIFAIAAGYMTYLFLERPLIQFFRRFHSGQRRIAVASAHSPP